MAYSNPDTAIVRSILNCLAALTDDTLRTPTELLLLLLAASIGTEAIEPAPYAAEGTVLGSIRQQQHLSQAAHALMHDLESERDCIALTHLIEWTRLLDLETQLSNAAFQREMRNLLTTQGLLFKLLPAIPDAVAQTVLMALVAHVEFVTLHGALWLRDAFVARPIPGQLAEHLLNQVKKIQGPRLRPRTAAPPAGHLYLSYAPTDGLDNAAELYGLLTQGGIDTWFDRAQIKVDQEWDLTIQSAIEDCRLMLVLVTPDQANSAVYHHERRLAARAQRQVIYTNAEHVDNALVPDDGPLIDLRHDREAALQTLRGLLSQPEVPRPDSALVEQQRERTRLRVTTAGHPLRSGQNPFQRFLDMMTVDGRAPYFGRADEQDRLARAIADRERLALVHGPAGIGKTQLVCQVLNRLLRSGVPDLTPEVIGFSTAIAPIDIDQIYSGVFQRLRGEYRLTVDRVWQDPTLPLAQKVTSLFGALVDRHYILVLDGLDLLQDPETGQFTDSAWEELLHAALVGPRPLTLILTARTQPRFTVQMPLAGLDLELKGLLDEDTVALLKANAADGHLGLRNVPDQDLIAFSRTVQGNPQALEALRVVLRQDPGSSLDESPHEETGQWLVQQALLGLSPEAQRLVAVLGLFAGPIAQHAIEFVVADLMETSQVQPLLHDLARKGIARRDRSGSWWTLTWHDENYLYLRIPPGTLAHDRLVSPAEAQAAEVLHELGIATSASDQPRFTRIGLHYRAAAYYQLIRLPVEACHTLDDLAPQLAEFAHCMRAGGYNDAAALLVQFDTRCLAAWGHFRLMIAMHERLQDNLSDSMLASLSAGHLAHAYATIGQLDQAIIHFDKALSHARAAENPRAEAIWLEELGRLYYRMDHLGQSAGCYGQALAIAREYDDVPAQARRASFLGLVYYALGELDHALEYHRQALAVHLEHGDHHAAATDHGNLGLVYYALGELDRALKYHQQALDVHLEHGDHHAAATDHGNLGLVYYALGELDRALEYHQQALAVHLEQGHHYAEATDHGNLGLVYYALGELDRALEYHQQALLLGRQIGDRTIEALSLSNLGETLLAQGQIDAALDRQQTAIALLADGDGSTVHHYCQCALAVSRLIAHDFNGAQEAILTARMSDVAANNYQVAALSGLIALGRNDPAVASVAFEDCVRRTTALLEKATSPHVLYARALAWAGLANLGEGDLQRAIEDYRHAQQLCRAPGLHAASLRLLDVLDDCMPGAVVPEIRQTLSDDQA